MALAVGGAKAVITAILPSMISSTVPSLQLEYHLGSSRQASIDQMANKRQDGITVVPWMNGQLLVWDATCPDTFAPSYVSNATRKAGAVAALAVERKHMKYSQLDSSHQFEPVAIETTGVIGERSRKFLVELGRRIRRVSGEVNSTAFLLQRLSTCNLLFHFLP